MDNNTLKRSVAADEQRFRESVLSFFSRSFPEGLREEDRLPLMYVLRQRGMSFRRVASFMAAVRDSDYVLFLNDAHRVESPGFTVDPAIIGPIEKRLLDCNFQQWLDE